MRARGFAGRDTFPERLRGVRTAEELRDLPPLEAAPIDTEPIAPRRASDAARPQSTDRLGSDALPPSEGGAADPRRPAPASVSVPPLPPDGAITADASASSVPNGGEIGTSSAAVPSRTSVPPRETRGLRITHTAFVKPKTGEPYYEVEATLNNGGKVTFVTRDEPLYKEAASFEGTDHFVAITWVQAKAAAQKVVSLLQGIAIDETRRPFPTPPAAPDAPPDLFQQ